MDGEGRPTRVFLQPGGDQPDDAGMPFVAGCHDDCRPGAAGQLRIGFGAGLGEHGLLHGLAFAIQPVQRFGDCLRLDRIVARKQPAAERRVADAAAGIDARTEQKAEMKGADRLANARGAYKGRDAGILHMADGDQPLHDIGAVDAGQRHDVANGGKRDEVEQGQEIEPRQVGRALTQDRRAAHKREKHHPRRAQMPLPRQIVLAVGIDHRNGSRQRRRRPDDGRARRHRRRIHLRP